MTKRTPKLPATLAVALLVAVGPLLAADDDDVINAAPLLVSVDSDGPAWTTTAELIAVAHEGDPEACFQYAQLLETGDGVDRNQSKAFDFYQRAAAAGQPNALFRVGKVLHEGLLNQEADQARAFTYYQKAALAQVPEATYNVGAMLVSGRGVKRNYREGLAWLMLAADQGADPTGAERVRERIKSRPEWIAAAEKRYAELQKEIAAVQPEDLKAAPIDTGERLTLPTPTMENPLIMAPSIQKPKIETPTISTPKITLPPPTTAKDK